MPLSRRDVAQRNVEVLPVDLCSLVVPYVLPMKKTSPTDVETRQPDVESIRQQTAIGEVFGEMPIDRTILVDRLAPSIE